MSEARRLPSPLADFLVWEARQPARYEFVGGRAVMMAGGTQAHALIAANLVAALRPLLRGTPCRPAGSDLRVPIPATGHARYPDVTIDCGRFDPEAHDASEPAVIFEVLSRSTGWYDQTQKLRDYETLPSLRQYVCISQSECRVSVWRRDGAGRLVAEDDLVAPDAMLRIDGCPAPIPLDILYEGLDPAALAAG